MTASKLMCTMAAYQANALVRKGAWLQFCEQDVCCWLAVTYAPDTFILPLQYLNPGLGGFASVNPCHLSLREGIVLCVRAGSVARDIERSETNG